MKRILVVDDVRNFPFDEADTGYVARTSQEALVIMGLASGTRLPLDELWLDFDLGGVFGQLELFDTAMPIALWLAECAYYGVPYPVEKIMIHSANPVGAQAMESTLRHHGYDVLRMEAHFHV